MTLEEFDKTVPPRHQQELVDLAARQKAAILNSDNPIQLQDTYLALNTMMCFLSPSDRQTVLRLAKEYEDLRAIHRAELQPSG